MTTHSIILAWRIPWREEPGGLQCMGLQRVGHYWSNLAQYTTEKISISASLTTLKPLCWSQILWKILKEMGVPDSLTCVLRNLYTSQEGHGTMNWFQIGKGIHQGCILSACLFNFYAEYIIWNAGLNEAQAGIKITGRNTNNLRYVDETTLMEESEGTEEFSSSTELLMKVKEESIKAGLKLNIKKKWRLWLLVPSLHDNRMGKNGNSGRLYFLGLQNHCWQWLHPWS